MVLFLPKELFTSGKMMKVFSQWYKNHTFSWFGFKQKRMLYFFCSRRHSPVILFPFLLSPKVFVQFRSDNLWKIVWICVIIFWLIKISCLNFSNSIFLPRQYFTNNSLGREWYIMDDFCCISHRGGLNNSDYKGWQTQLLIHIAFQSYRIIFGAGNIFVIYIFVDMLLL